jgi:hypothetical protein
MLDEYSSFPDWAVGLIPEYVYHALSAKLSGISSPVSRALLYDWTEEAYQVKEKFERYLVSHAPVEFAEAKVFLQCLFQPDDRARIVPVLEERIQVLTGLPIGAAMARWREYRDNNILWPLLTFRGAVDSKWLSLSCEMREFFKTGSICPMPSSWNSSLLFRKPSPLHFSLHTYGPFFALLGKIDLQRATEIHQAKRKPFTLIPLPDKHTLHFRVTTLDNALFAPFLEVLLEEAPCGLSFSPESLPPRRATDWRAGLPGRPAQAPPAQDLILLRFR